ncbi:hypothetical protein WUMEUNZI_CDS0035 [Salmonella phage SeKF_63]
MTPTRCFDSVRQYTRDKPTMRTSMDGVNLIRR